MTRRRRNRLSPEDDDLWRRVTQSVTPMKDRPPSIDPPPTPLPAPMPQPVDAPSHGNPKDSASWTVEPFRIGQKSGSTPAGAAPAAPKPVAPIDKRLHKNLRRGKHKPDARIDLHGMTLATAHPALANFVRRSHASGKRLLLVITGKGTGGPEVGYSESHRGILRRQVPQWLTTPPLSSLVLHVQEAHIRHGGQGALYVFLRRHG